MFIIGQAHDVSFNVTVMGTGAEPSVRLVLGCNPELSFPARLTPDGWLSTVTIPTGIEPCECDMRIEVVINNRLFTPLTKRVQLQQMDVPISVEQPTADTIEFVAPVPTADTTQPAPDTPRISIMQMVGDREKVHEKLELPAFVPAKSQVKPIQLEDSPKPQMSALKKAVAAPSVVRPLISTSTKPAPSKQVEKFNILDIVNIAESIPTKKVAAKKPRPVVEFKQETPVKLIKGDIIYE